MKTIIALVTLIAVTCASVGMAASKKDAFTGISKKDFKKQIDYVAISPLFAPGFLEFPGSAQVHIESMLVARLEKLGYRVMPSETMKAIREQLAAQIPTVPGESKQAAADKESLVLDHSLRELLFRHPVDAVLGISIQVVGAPFEGDKVSWDGVSRKIKHKGDGLFKSLSGSKYQGTIAVSSLRLTIWDRNETPLYTWAGGLDVLMRRNAKKLEQIPASELWQEEKRLVKAVKIALDPL